MATKKAPPLKAHLAELDLLVGKLLAEDLGTNVPGEEQT